MPKLRVFAGPNGSGKSTIKVQLDEVLHIHIYVNADELEAQAKVSGFIDLEPFGIQTTFPQLLEFHTTSRLLIKEGLVEEAMKLGLVGSKVDYRNVAVNSYFASVISDFIRQRLIEQGASFTFETVMSHDSKVEIMRQAQALGYRTYLYFVSTEDPEINVDRVRIRVEEGGHMVAPDKVRSRYYNSLSLLPAAVACSNRAYIFDNSGDVSVLLAEITDGTQLEFKTEEVPEWLFTAYVDKVTGLAEN